MAFTFNKTSILALAILYAVSFLPAADTPTKKDEKPPAEIKGIWNINFVRNGKQDAFLFGKQVVPLTIGEKEAEWPKGIVNLFDKAGKGDVTIEAAKTPPTIELAVEGNVYKGIYRISREKDGKRERLLILFSEPGGDFPKDFNKESPFILPKGFKGVIFGGERNTN